jgi:hypothetical protein
LSDFVTTVFGEPARVQAIRNDGRWLAASADGKRIAIYDLETGTQTDVRAIETGWPKGMAIKDGCGRFAPGLALRYRSGPMAGKSFAGFGVIPKSYPQLTSDAI